MDLVNKIEFINQKTTCVILISDFDSKIITTYFRNKLTPPISLQDI